MIISLFLSAVINLVFGISFLILWKKYQGHKFVYYIGWSFLIQMALSFSYGMYTVVEPKSFLSAFSLFSAALCSSMYLSIMLLGVLSLKNINVSINKIMILFIPLFVLNINTLYFYGLVEAQLLYSILITTMGAVSCWLLWSKSGSEWGGEYLFNRYIGISLILLGLTQAIYPLSGGSETGTMMQANIGIFFRTILALLFFSVAMQKKVHEVKALKQKSENINQNIPLGILLINKKGQIVYLNKKIAEIYELHAKKITLKTILRMLDMQSKIYLHTQIKNLSKKINNEDNNNGNNNKTLINTKVGNNTCKYLKYDFYIKEIDGEVLLQVIIVDETQVYDAHKKIERQELNDELTLLPNRQAMLKLLKARCNGQAVNIDSFFDDNQKHKFYQKKFDVNYFIMLLDIDRFKNLNDGHGFAFGDELLKTFGALLVNTAGIECDVFRLGKDEFALVSKINDDFNEIKIIEIEEKIKKLLTNPIIIDNGNFFVDISMGGSVYPMDGLDVQTLLLSANIALGQAKDIPGTNLVTYKANTKINIKNIFDLEQDLKKNIGTSDFYLVYQPKISTKTKKITGFEALVRWNRNGEFISPIDFIPLAEKIGLIENLGNSILEMACKQIKYWENKNMAIQVAVNISPFQLMNQRFSIIVKDCINKYQINANNLVLEITEGTAIKNINLTFKHMNDLKSIGVKFAMDDFGVGYSSINILSKLSIDILKIDKSLTDELGSETGREIVKSIIHISKKLNLKIVAEGVETQEQNDFYAENNCDDIQGYFYSKPVSVEDANILLLKNN